MSPPSSLPLALVLVYLEEKSGNPTIVVANLISVLKLFTNDTLMVIQAKR